MYFNIFSKGINAKENIHTGFELKSPYPFSMTPAISLLSFYKDDWQPMKVNMPLNKETKPFPKTITVTSLASTKLTSK